MLQTQDKQIMLDDTTTLANSDSPHEVILERVGIGARGERYSVTYNGEVVCAASRDPEFDACRVLVERGLTGRLVTRWKGSPHTAMTMSLAWGATKRTEESATVSPLTSPFKTFGADLDT